MEQSNITVLNIARFAIKALRHQRKKLDNVFESNFQNAHEESERVQIFNGKN